MRQETINIYKFEELPEETQEKVIERWISEGGNYHWHDDNVASLKAFEDTFDVKVKNFEYGYHCHISAEYNIDEDIENLEGVRLLKYIINNYYDILFTPKYLGHKSGKAYYSKIQRDNCCVFTGYDIDNALLDAFYNFIIKPVEHVTLKDLLENCLNGWVNACQKDYKYANSSETIKENIIANNYEFTADGKLY